MEPNLQIVLRRYQPTELVLARVRARLVSLQRRTDDILRCHVDLEGRPTADGDQYRVFVQVTLVRGDVLRVDDDRGLPNDEMTRAVDRAFDQLAMQLEARAPGTWRRSAARAG